jgi:two-component system phosphate regulon response regulator OmpR
MPETSPTEDPRHLLIVDDDERLRAVLRRFLERNGFRVTEAAHADDAEAKLQNFAFDLLVLDVMMPGRNGLDLLGEIRRTDRVPVLMLTAMAEAEHRIQGLERGADDYLAKPFEPRELLLRIRNILNRAPQPAPPAPEPAKEILLGTCRFDPARGELTRQGAPVHLTAGEAALLSALAERAGEPLSRDALGAHGNFSGTERNIDVQITRLRRKIERDPKYPRYLQTVRGIGYVLKPD